MTTTTISDESAWKHGLIWSEHHRFSMSVRHWLFRRTLAERRAWLDAMEPDERKRYEDALMYEHNNRG